MGKALIFEGVTVSNPLRTVTFAPGTAEEWVDNFSDVVTLTSSEKNALTTFVDTLMNNNLWDSVRDFFPMLGGIDGYMKSLKRPNGAPNWNAPSNGTTWDSTRNAPYLSLPGLAKGTPLVYDGDEKFNTQNATFIFGCKLAKFSGGGYTILLKDYSYGGGSVESLTNNLKTSFPKWMPVDAPASTPSGYVPSKNKHLYYTISFSSSNIALYAQTNSDLYSINTATALTEGTSESRFAFGGYFAADSGAPAGDTMNGILCSFVSMDSAITQAQASVISDALYALDVALGRNVDFE